MSKQNEAQAHLVAQLERLREQLIFRAAVHGLTPEEASFATNIDYNLRTHQQQALDAQEKPE